MIFIEYSLFLALDTIPNSKLMRTALPMKFTLYSFCIFVVLVISIFSCKQLPQKNTQTNLNNARFTGVLADSAMVVSAHPLASKVGVEILKEGGTAVDAAIAVQFALTVVYPRAGNIGGGGFMLIREGDGQLNSLDFREKAPLSSSRDMYLDEAKEVVPRLSLDGHLAVGVPGVVAGMVEAHKKYGKLDWATLLEPAIILAEKGHKVSEKEVEYLNEHYKNFEKFSTETNYFAHPKGKWIAGDMLKQEDLGATLRRIQKEGRNGFYKGKTAQYLLEEMQRGGGIIAQEDLDNYQAVWRKPLIGKYKENYRIISMSPPSSGGVAILQMCEMMEQFPISEWGFQSHKTAHVMIESERRAYADRATHLGDPDYFPVPIEGLLDEGYLSERAKSINIEGISPSKTIREGKVKGAVESNSSSMPKRSPTSLL